MLHIEFSLSLCKKHWVHLLQRCRLRDFYTVYSEAQISHSNFNQKKEMKKERASPYSLISWVSRNFMNIVKGCLWKMNDYLDIFVNYSTDNKVFSSFFNEKFVLVFSSDFWHLTVSSSNILFISFYLLRGIAAKLDFVVSELTAKLLHTCWWTGV